MYGVNHVTNTLNGGTLTIQAHNPQWFSMFLVVRLDVNGDFVLSIKV